MIIFTVKGMETYYGAAVTASHNPADYNGVKIFTKGGRDATEEVTTALEVFISEIIDPFNDYIDTIINMIDMEVIKNRKMEIVLDPMFGVSKTCLQTILLTARRELEIINDRHGDCEKLCVNTKLLTVSLIIKSIPFHRIH